MELEAKEEEHRAQCAQLRVEQGEITSECEELKQDKDMISRKYAQLMHDKDKFASECELKSQQVTAAFVVILHGMTEMHEYQSSCTLGCV